MSIITHSPLYFTPEEVVKLGKEQGATGTLDIVTAIEKAWGTQYDNPEFNYACMLSAIFEAGYIQGKREERKRVAERKEKHAERLRTDEKEQYRHSARVYLDMTDSAEALKMQSDMVYHVWKLWKHKGKFQDK